ncbi:MAG: crosslink repair DNA glycosylase YcaQ family protein [Casimicrobiaceae bacterium]
MLTITDLRRFAIARSLFRPTTLQRAIERLGFVQADPIRAPARAQDLTLRHRVRNYRAGDLERRYARLPVDEDFFINYGFMPRGHLALMHPRRADTAWDAATARRARAILAFVREQGTAHPRAIDLHFAHGTVRNYWGGASNATTHLLLAMHYRGLLRVVRRDNGVRVYAAHAHAPPALALHARLDALVDILVQAYAPLPSATLTHLIRRLRYAVPQWRSDLPAAIGRARGRLSRARVEGTDWWWPADENPATAQGAAAEARVRLLAPFDPIVWDRDRFARFWQWDYRFEAYTPAAKRERGYYALPLLWRDEIIGWANLAVRERELRCEAGYVAGRAPRDPRFRTALVDELASMRTFLGLR